MAVLDSARLHYIVAWLYFALLESTMALIYTLSDSTTVTLYSCSNWLYLTVLHSTMALIWLYLALPDSVMLYHDSTWLDLTLLHCSMVVLSST